MATEQPWEQIGKAFLAHYYSCFDGDRAQLAPLYVSQQPQPLTLIHSQSPSIRRHLTQLLGLIALLL